MKRIMLFLFFINLYAGCGTSRMLPDLPPRYEDVEQAARPSPLGQPPSYGALDHGDRPISANQSAYSDAGSSSAVEGASSLRPVRQGVPRTFILQYMRNMQPENRARWAIVKKIAQICHNADTPRESLLLFKPSEIVFDLLTLNTFWALTGGVPSDCSYTEDLIQLSDGGLAVEKRATCIVTDASGERMLREYKMYTIFGHSFENEEPLMAVSYEGSE